MSTLYYESSIAHHGVKGQKWGVRRFQDKNGRLTSAGKKRFSDSDKKAEKRALQVERGRKLAEQGATMARIGEEANRTAIKKALPSILTGFAGSAGIGVVAAATILSTPASAVAVLPAAGVASIMSSFLGGANAVRLMSKHTRDIQDLNMYLGERRREHDMKG